ncbi:universal stress protein [Hoeflea sp. TYP-13]|uniref:universal stress protein n=1 Tax=Hoeflea sp. TYP-13 TaxID=3230023 RepID=UPI0034C6C328
MPDHSAIKQDFDEGPQVSDNGVNGDAPQVVACIDGSPASTKVIPHANAIANALGGELSLVHVVESDNAQAPYDPVEWDIRKRQADLYMTRIASRFDTGPNPISFKILEGRSAEQIGECTAGNAGDITAFCRGSDSAHHRLGETARRILESTPGSLLLVPATVPEADVVNYSRILVPLDGSSRAESAIPFAVRIAQQQNAEIILVHATPKLDFLGAAPQHVQDMELQEQLSRRSARLAAEYMKRTQTMLADCDVTIHCVLLKSGDVRRLLEDAIASQSADLLVMSSHGQSGYSDVPAGDVSSFILCRASTPVLLVRRPQTTEAGHVYANVESKGVRRPYGTSG